MPETIHHVSCTDNRRRGVALLTVLFVVMAVTVISLGILARSSTELACGQNMALRVELDQLAASGLEHARGLALNPQDIASEYWTGAAGLQLDTGSRDFYDVNMIRDESDPGVRCNYTIESRAYRLDGSDEIGASRLSAVLRLDPCIALWTSGATTIVSGLTVYGDVRCGGNLTNYGSIAGDVFATALAPSGSNVTGQLNPQSLLLAWPNLAVADFTDPANYTVHVLSSSVISDDLGPYDPPHVFYRNGDLIVDEAVTIDGMLLVDGDLTIRSSDVTLIAAKNVPAVYVTGDLVIEDVDNLTIQGLVAVDGDTRLSVGAAGLSVRGGFFVDGNLLETAPDSSGYHRDLVAFGTPTWGSGGGVELDGSNDKLEDASAQTYLNGLAAITVSLWVKSDVVSQDRGIMFTRNPTGADEELGLRYDARGAYGGARSCIKASIRTTTGYTQIESSAYAQTTSWQHLALVWQTGDRLKLYVDGNPDSLTYDQGPCSGTVWGVEKSMLGLDTKNRHWDGCMSDVRIYDQALNDGQVLALSQHLSAGLPNPITHWELNESGTAGQITADPAKAAVVVWPGANRTRWSPAAGAFFKAVSREPQ